MFVILLLALAVLGGLGLRTFDRDGEWAVVFRFGRATRERIRGPWVAYRRPQLPVGSRVVVATFPLIERVQRVQGDLLEAWQELRDTVPNGVVIDRPRLQATTGFWTTRAHGRDEDSVDPYGLDVEGRGLTEASAIRDLEAQVWDAMRDE